MDIASGHYEYAATYIFYKFSSERVCIAGYMADIGKESRR